MVSKESSGAGNPWTDAEKITLRRLLGKRLRLESKVVPHVDSGVEYSQLVSKAELADGVWYRGYPEGRSHEFVLVLTNPDKEVLRKAYKTERELQGEFPLAWFDFQFRYSALSRKDKADLKKNGYKWVSGMEQMRMLSKDR